MLLKVCLKLDAEEIRPEHVMLPISDPRMCMLGTAEREIMQFFRCSLNYSRVTKKK